MTKYVGWPEPSEVNGHMLKSVGGPPVKDNAEFVCQDTHVRADYHSFDVGVRGCEGRPASLDYLTIFAWDGFETMSTQQRAAASRDHWKNFADRIALKVSNWTPVDDDPEVCARFTFWYDEQNAHNGAYELRFGQKGSRPHEIHAVRV